MKAPALPVDTLLPEITAALRSTANLVVEAAPGAGKTTRIPPALLKIVDGEIIVLEPRRIAARMSARRVAFELGEQPGQTVGYQVRFDEVAGPNTRLRFVTEGVLTRRLLSDPDLKGVDAVVLDEFHERHLDSDLALALLRRLQARRPGLRILVMSATLEAAPIAEYLNHCPVLRSEGRTFPITITHLPYSPQPLDMQVRSAVELLLREGEQGHILAFLPGAAEIRRAMRTCEPVAERAGLLMLPLHGDLSSAEQDLAVAPSQQQKLILATNVAESSLTVEGVTAVIDSGLARTATHSPWTGLPSLHIGRISKASAKQRAGRAGRTAPGRVIRLYPEEDFAHRADYDAPEIVRSDLSQLCLTLRSMGVEHIAELEWLDTPPENAVKHAESLLDSLHAHGTNARELARFPLPPRLARVLMESIQRGVGEAGCRAMALLGSGARSPHTDLLEAMDAGLDSRTQQHASQLRRIARIGRQATHDEDALLLSILCGFPDRVARRKTGNQLLLANGISAELAGSVPSYEFLVALDAEDRNDKPQPLVRMISRIEPDWLIELFPDRVREQSTLTWNKGADRVESVTALLYEQLVLQEWHDASPDPEAAAELLAQKVLENLEQFVDPDVLNNLKERFAFAKLGEPDIAGVVRGLCYGLRSFAEFRSEAVQLVPALETSADSRRLHELAPSTIRLQGGRQTKVHYEHGKPPWIASRLQDFFGMHETPRIGPEQTPVVVHLLAPNRRAVQTTTDLAGFWTRLYPQVRKELMRRYPRHAWPENV
ncbi:MAG: ATP-dependent helicase HrpB [Acidobacteria bacterium]|nr:ATP-dependent helicase HrpB [Acidobacteriota bacterium]